LALPLQLALPLPLALALALELALALALPPPMELALRLPVPVPPQPPLTELALPLPMALGTLLVMALPLELLLVMALPRAPCSPPGRRLAAGSGQPPGPVQAPIPRCWGAGRGSEHWWPSVTTIWMRPVCTDACVDGSNTVMAL